MADKRILVVRGGAIGDFILTLPVLAAIRGMLPSATLDVLGYPRIAELARWGGLADQIRSLESPPMARFFARRAILDPEWEGYFGSCAIVISYLFDPDGIFQENVARCSRAQFIQGPHRPPDDGAFHATEVLLQPLQRLAIFDPSPIPLLPLPPVGAARRTPEGEPEIGAWLGGLPTLAIHPGSGGERKNWPEPKWRQLLEALMKSGALRVLLVGGEAEGERLERLAAGLDSSRIQILRSAPLPEVARVLAGCTGFVGHDSGITHLAAAVGLPVIVIWGPTVEHVWRPQGMNVRVVRHAEGLGHLDTETVFNLVMAHWGPRMPRA